MTNSVMTAARLWKAMPTAQRTAVAEAFWQDEEATDDQIQAVMLIAQHKRFRPKTVIGLDLDRKTKHLASLLTLPELIAARALVIYHLAARRPMMGAFLDALGIAHEDGLIKDDQGTPDAAKLEPAVNTLLETYPADDVSLYLQTLLCQDAETWGGLAELAAKVKPADAGAAT